MDKLVYPIHKVDKTEKNKGFGIDFDYFKKGVTLPSDNEVAEDPMTVAKRRGRPKKKQIGGNMVTTGEEENGDLNELQSNKPYSKSYDDTTNMLRGSINQIDSLSNDINTELQGIRASKTLKRKYEYITDLTGTSSSLIGTKIAAIREINSTITNCHNLEMKRMKELHLDVTENDDQSIMNMYNAFVNTPVGLNAPNLGPSIQDINGLGMSNMQRTDIAYTGDPGYDNHLQNMTPAQNMMVMEKNPNIKTVVRYNQNTGVTSFDIIDTTTGASVPNLARPGDFLLKDMNINMQNNTARNSQAELNYPLVVDGYGNFNEI